MKSIFNGTLSENETVFFNEWESEKALLFPADEILSVTSYDRSITYERGTDFDLKDKKLVRTKDSRIPFIPDEIYFNAYKGNYITTIHNGKEVHTYWGEDDAMTKWQTCITYTHSEPWNGFLPEGNQHIFTKLLNKLSNGEDVTVIFYGDSITYGANSSFALKRPPYQHTYPMLFVEQLADKYGYNVRYIPTDNLPYTCHVPDTYHPERIPTLTYINPSVCGWTTKSATENFEYSALPFIREYGCDLFIPALGMNDQAPPTGTYENGRAIYDKVLDAAPDTAFLAIATMVPNNETNNGPHCHQEEQEKYLINGFRNDYLPKGVPCAVVPMGSMSLSVLEKKRFVDYTGNNINHPNDFFARVYAETMLRTIDSDFYA